jgi:hypothetical protein
MRKELKRAFKLGTIDSVQAWDMDRGHAHFLTQDFDIFAVETEMGRKGFKTFDGAFNKFMKMSKGFKIEIVLENFETFDEETFLANMEAE